MKDQNQALSNEDMDLLLHVALNTCKRVVVNSGDNAKHAACLLANSFLNHLKETYGEEAIKSQHACGSLVMAAGFLVYAIEDSESSKYIKGSPDYAPPKGLTYE